MLGNPGVLFPFPIFLISLVPHHVCFFPPKIPQTLSPSLPVLVGYQFKYGLLAMISFSPPHLYSHGDCTSTDHPKSHKLRRQTPFPDFSTTHFSPPPTLDVLSFLIPFHMRRIFPLPSCLNPTIISFSYPNHPLCQFPPDTPLLAHHERHSPPFHPPHELSCTSVIIFPPPPLIIPVST